MCDGALPREKDSLIRERPSSPILRMDLWRYCGVLAVSQTHFPNILIRGSLRVVNGLAICGFKSRESSSSSHLNWLTTLIRDFPDLPLSTAVRSEVNPRSIA